MKGSLDSTSNVAFGDEPAPPLFKTRAVIRKTACAETMQAEDRSAEDDTGSKVNRVAFFVSRFKRRIGNGSRRPRVAEVV